MYLPPASQESRTFRVTMTPVQKWCRIQDHRQAAHTKASHRAERNAHVETENLIEGAFFHQVTNINFPRCYHPDKHSTSILESRLQSRPDSFHLDAGFAGNGHFNYSAAHP